MSSVRATTRSRRRCQRIPERRGRSRPATFPGARAGGRDHRHLRRVRRARRAARARAAAGAANSSKYRCWRRWRISRSSRSPRSSRSASRRRHPIVRAWRRRTSCAPPTTGSSRSICRRSKSSGSDSSRRWRPMSSRAIARFSERLARISNYEALGEALDQRFQAPLLAGVGRAPERQRRAVRADQRHRCRRRGSAGRSSRVDRAGRWRAAGRSARRAPPLQFDGERERAVVAAPLLDQHGTTIRAAVTDSRHWPARAGQP